MTSLNTIALISGGKDSFYSLLHCIQTGHKIIALGNLYPAPPAAQNGNNESSGQSTNDKTQPSLEDDEDINSFLYQTIGHNLIPLYGAALQLPLYRQQIIGSATQSGQAYDPSIQNDGQLVRDEAESLTLLLQTILENHPEANAVSTGAILSTYQRVRIESVATRLGLVPLSLLWQYPVLPPAVDGRDDSLVGLLDDMATAGCDARIIKIASGGLGKNLLWANVADSRTKSRLVKGMAPFHSDDDEMGLRGAILGEGGEYETLTLDGPRSVWKGGRIEVEESRIKTGTGEGGVMWTKIEQGAAKVVPTESRSDERPEEEALVPIPRLFDPQFETVLSSLTKQRESEERRNAMISASATSAQSNKKQSKLEGSHTEQAISKAFVFPIAESRAFQGTRKDSSVPLVQISNLASSSTPSNGSPYTLSPERPDIIDQTRQILTRLSKTLAALQCTSRSIISTTLLLCTMTDFTPVNAIYSTFFPPGMPWPPARVTIALGDRLPPGVDVAMSVLVDTSINTTTNATARDQKWRGLHVQSRSYWAPANIGPYSQAISVPEGENFEVVHLAGQIPLIPVSMTLHSVSFIEEAMLALQHLWRVAQERRVSFFTSGVAFLPRLGGKKEKEREMMCWEMWRESNSYSPASDDENEDNGGLDAWDMRFNRTFQHDRHSTVKNKGRGGHLHTLPSHSLTSITSKIHFPPLVIAEVEALPRNASVEWCGLGVKPTPLVKVIHGETRGRWGSASWTKICPGKEKKSVFVTILVEVDVDAPALISILQDTLGSSDEKMDVVHGTAYLNTSTDSSGGPASASALGLAIIPCHNLWSALQGPENSSTLSRLALAVDVRVDVWQRDR